MPVNVTGFKERQYTKESVSLKYYVSEQVVTYQLGIILRETKYCDRYFTVSNCIVSLFYYFFFSYLFSFS